MGPLEKWSCLLEAIKMGGIHTIHETIGEEKNMRQRERGRSEQRLAGWSDQSVGFRATSVSAQGLR